MSDYLEAVREWEELDQHGGLPYEANDVWVLADAAIAALKEDRDYYREHYELVLKQRNEAEKRVAELEPVVRHERNPHTTHYDGCYQYHFDCAIERVAELEADYREALNNNGVLKDLEAEQKDRAEGWKACALRLMAKMDEPK